MNADHPSDSPGSTRPRLRRCGALLSAAAACVLAGCTTTHVVKVDSLSKPKAENAISYEIKNKNPLVADDSLRYQEAANLVKTALSGRGMYEAPPNTKADMVVDLDYGVGPPQMRKETVSEPVYITVPGQIRTERVQVGTDSQGRPIYQTITVQDPPTTEFAGFREYIVTVIVYEKYLKLSARENKVAEEGKPQTQIWTVDVTSEGESRDIRKNLPVLVAASIDYIGKDSQGQKTIRIKDTSSDIAFVKKGM
ncbi:MAG: hypothetical protein HZC55_26235 [Verrucomicrobia bacterium]|nr:hypothetical protein [Verrucomicrobiota bacterium]